MSNLREHSERALEALEQTRDEMYRAAGTEDTGAAERLRLRADDIADVCDKLRSDLAAAPDQTLHLGRIDSNLRRSVWQGIQPLWWLTLAFSGLWMADCVAGMLAQ